MIGTLVRDSLGEIATMARLTPRINCRIHVILRMVSGTAEDTRFEHRGYGCFLKRDKTAAVVLK
jgi:hypothetical protein